MSQRFQRKEEHLALAKMFFNSNKDNDFNHVHLIRPALPESAVNKDSISTEMFGHKISAPFFINAMTGGSDTSYIINQRLAKAAAAENIPMALGSASILEKEIDQIKSFEVARQENPDGLIFANVNPTTDPKVAQKIVDALDAYRQCAALILRNLSRQCKPAVFKQTFHFSVRPCLPCRKRSERKRIAHLDGRIIRALETVVHSSICRFIFAL